MTLSLPLNPDPRWLSEVRAPYTLTKFGMTVLTLGLAQQHDRPTAYCLWPQTLIATAAVQNVVAGSNGMKAARIPEIIADAAYLLFTPEAATTSGRCHIDADVLRATGRDDLSAYAAVPGTADGDLELDLFI